MTDKIVVQPMFKHVQHLPIFYIPEDFHETSAKAVRRMLRNFDNLNETTQDKGSQKYKDNLFTLVKEFATISDPDNELQKSILNVKS